MVLSILCIVPFSAGAVKTWGDYEYSEYEQYSNYGYWVKYVEITKYYGSTKNLYLPTSINGRTVGAIGNSAFEGNKALEMVVVGEGVTSIGLDAFKDCTYLYMCFLPSTVDTIAGNPFTGCKNLNEIRIASDNNGYYVSNGAVISSRFRTLCCYPPAKSDTSYTIPNKVESIELEAFWGCNNLKELIFPDSVTKIDRWAICDCKNLEKVILSENLESIGECGIIGCNNLKSIKIPKSVTSIGYSALGCYSSNWNPMSDFTIYGTRGTEAERYAQRKKFIFIDTDAKHLLGDADKDGKVTIIDATYIQKWLAQMITEDEIDLSVCDTDRDNSVTIVDATKIQKFLAGIIEEL